IINKNKIICMSDKTIKTLPKCNIYIY
ncbi:hypothetical protein, partial [Plasmodium yoelii yoelii]